MSSPSLDTNLQREFRCDHCKGLIRIPISLPSTTGPCPHCGETITSPDPAEPTGDLPSDASPAAETPPDKGPPVAETSTAPGEEQEAKSDVVFPEPEEDTSAEEAEEDERRRSLLPVALVFLVVACVVTLVITLAIKESKKQTEQPSRDEIVEESESASQTNYIRTGWKREAYQVLGDFIAAGDARAKIPLVVNGDKLADRIVEFYQNGGRQDIDTPAEAFSVYDLPEDDRRKGMFMLVFDQPPQLDMRNFFRPVASLEVQYGLTQADLLLSSMALVSNFSLEPLRVHAFFLKTDEGLKLDWEIFAQTKYRLLRSFVETPEIGKTAVFRVFIAEDVPDRGLASSAHRTYRVADPANMDDGARILVAVDSDVGRKLTTLNWIDIPGGQQHNRTATVELEWRGDASEPQLAIKQFICWEFLGLGGVKTAKPPGVSEIKEP